jgi:[lysine-biosynthesis-protein LysW]--L-2-aminoadipate ligase
MRVGVLYSRIRRDEKLLLEALRDRGHAVEKIDVRDQRFGLTATTAPVEDLDVVVDRCLSTSRSLYATQFLETYGVPVVNAPETADICADKAKNSLALAAADVPTPETEVAFTTDAAMEARALRRRSSNTRPRSATTNTRCSTCRSSSISPAATSACSPLTGSRSQR